MAIIELEEVTFTYAGREVPSLSAVSATIHAGEMVGVVGANGSGKTTMGYCIAGVIPNLIRGRLVGRIRVSDTEADQTQLHRRSDRIGYVFQDADNQFVTLRVRDELTLGLRGLGLSASACQERLEEVSEPFQLSAILNSSPDELSMGQKQRVALASVMIARPQILVLDEPGTTLDRFGRARLLQFLASLRERGVTLLLFSHDEDFVSRTDRIIGLRNGHIAFDKPRQEVAEADYERLWPQESHPVDYLPDGFAYPRAVRPAIGSLSFSLRSGQTLGVVGPNGSGKSTLLLLLAGLLEPTNGRIELRGRSLQAIDERDLVSEIGILFQNPNHQLFAATIREELTFGLHNLGLPAAEIERRMNWATAFFRLPALDTDPQSLSYGWRRILSLAAVLVMDPFLLLLDEPELGLDAYFRRRFAYLLQGWKEGGKTVVIASHDPALLSKSPDGLLWMDNAGCS